MSRKPWFGAPPQDRRANPNEARGQNTHNLTQGNPRHALSSNYKPNVCAGCFRVINIGTLTISAAVSRGGASPPVAFVDGPLTWANEDDHSVAFDIDFRRGIVDSYAFMSGRFDTTMTINDDRHAGPNGTSRGGGIELLLKMYNEDGTVFNDPVFYHGLIIATATCGSGSGFHGLDMNGAFTSDAGANLTADDPQPWESAPIYRTLKPHAFGLQARIDAPIATLDATIEDASLLRYAIEV